MVVLTAETCWALNEYWIYNKISGIKLVFLRIDIFCLHTKFNGNYLNIIKKWSSRGKRRCVSITRRSRNSFQRLHQQYCGPGSSVGIVTGYGLDGPGIESRWWARFSAPVQTGPGAHPASCTMGNGSFPGVNCGRGVTLTPHTLLVPWPRKIRAIPLHTLRACVACRKGENLPLQVHVYTWKALWCFATKLFLIAFFVGRLFRK